MRSDTTTALTVRIPISVDLRITPNRIKTNPGLRTRLRNELKDAAYLATVSAINTAGGHPVPPLVYDLIVARGKHRQAMDDDNISAWFKHGRDGIAAALGIDDRDMSAGAVTQIRDSEGIGFIEVEIKEQPS